MATKKFELKSWLSENREIVISKHNALTTEKHYSGISLKDFMVEVVKMMEINNVKSEKRAASKLPFLMGNIYFENSKVTGRDSKTEALAEKYKWTAAMALV